MRKEKAGKGGTSQTGGRGGSLWRVLEGRETYWGGVGGAGSADPGGGRLAAGREGCARGVQSRNMEWGGCMPDGGQGSLWAEGNTTRHTQESRLVPRFLGKGPGVSMEEGRPGGETPCRTNEQQLPKSKMHVCPQKQQTKPFWNQSCRHQHL